MDVLQTEENHLKVIDFNQKRYLLQHSFLGWLLNNRNDKEKFVKIEKYLYKHLATHPISVACSISVPMVEKKKEFKEEYIIPQLLMQWIRQNGEYDGLYNVLTKKIAVETPRRYDIDLIKVPEYLTDISKDIKEEPFHWEMDSLNNYFSFL